MATPTKHHKFGPSGLSSYERCPRFEKREEKEGEAHPVAVEGTMLHAKVERRDVSNLDAGQVTMVENCIAYQDQHTADAIELHQEILLDVCRKPDGSYVSFGTADVVAIYDSRAVCIDWKFGWNPVDDPKVNMQGACYAVGIFDKHPEIDEVEVHFYMARYADPYVHTFTRTDDYEALKLRILTVVARVEEEADYSPSTKACMYCAAKGRCPALAKHALALAETQTEEDLGAIVKIGSAEITDPADMQKALSVAALLEPWIKEIRADAKQMLMDGRLLYGYELKERRGKQELGNADAVYNLLKDEMTQDEFVEICQVPLTALKKLIAEKAPRGSKGLATELALGKLKSAGLINEGASSLYLAKTRRPKKI